MTGAIGDGAGCDDAYPPLRDAVRGDPGARTDNPDAGSAGPLPQISQQLPDDGETPGHWGLFSPSTVTWRVHSDPLIGLAILRSLALQVLHPEGLANVFATAKRVDDPWDRLAWTQRYLGVVTFGSGAEAVMMGARLRAVLTQVTGMTQMGQEFRGDDPELLLWMHCCQVASFVEVTRRGGLDLTDEEHETYIREQVRMAAVWGLETEQVPASRRDLTRYFRAARPNLRMTAAGRAFIGAIVGPALPELMTLPQRNRPPWAAISGLAYSALPPWARQLYTTGPASGSASLTQSATTVALHLLRDSLRAGPGQDEADPSLS
jgi:uncharacterized protein (DUF2236 family)